MHAARWLTISAFVLAPHGAVEAADAKGAEFFEQKIRPLFVKHCFECHSADAKKLKGGLRLDTRADTQKVVVAGDPKKSPLIELVTHADESMRMPPKAKLSAAEIADLEAWVKMGAPDPRGDETTLVKNSDLWSLKPLRKPAVPTVKATPPPNPIDAFILAKLEERGLKPAPAADKRTLIRRATFDLTGLPPTPEEITAFLQDDSPTAFAKVIDRLLASPHYGERWGRHWLDVVRYADTAGDNSDYPIPQMYRYRDWVIDAFNRDLPYDEFVRQQLAGDLLPAMDEADQRAKIVATGYLANSRRFGSYEDKRYPWNLTYDDTIDNLGRTFLALTINCCRCHDHKFDPLSQADYYALYGFFSSTRYPWPGIELDKVQHDLVPLAPPSEVAAHEKERQAKFAEFDAAIATLDKERKETEKQLQAAEKIANEAERKARVDELNKAMNALKAKTKATQSEKEAYGRKPLPYPTAYAVVEGKTAGNKKVGNARMHLKGDPERLGPEVPRRFPTVLGGKSLPVDTKGSGRLELANWIVDPKNPLTARVMANRLWQGHFGKGLAPATSNFGTLGQAPTHPELLDWLATTFMEEKWSIKEMHRQIMLSETYRRSSAAAPNSSQIDVNNDLLSYFPRRRLDAESIRDGMLAVSGSLDRTPGEAHPFPEMKAWNYTQHNPFKAVYDTNRRSVYLMTQRIQRHPFLALFDGADTNAGTPTRTTSTTSLQALYLMNDPFVHAQARKLAERLTAERSTDAGRIERVYLLLFGRTPTTAETGQATSFVKKLTESKSGSSAWESLSRALFLSNEFVYVE